MAPSDPFAALGLTRTASLDELRAARKRLAREVHPDVGGSDHAMRTINSAFDQAVRMYRATRTDQMAGDRAPVVRMQVDSDRSTFTVDRLPVEAFEYLLVVTSWIGEALVDDPPYLLEVHIFEPACWCRLELVPEAGASMVSVTVAAVDAPGPAPASVLERVRDLWVQQLNLL